MATVELADAFEWLKARPAESADLVVTEKPVEVNEVLVRQSTQPGELVIDPFCGSGSTGVAALRNGRRFAGCDNSEAAIEYASPRLTIISGPRSAQNAA